MEFIPYNEVLYQLNRTDAQGKPIPFSFTCSTGKGTFLTVNRAVKNVLKTIAERKEKKKEIPASAGMSERGAGMSERGAGMSDKKGKEAGDKEMFIRILDLDTGEIKTVYPRTFTFFNGFKVSPEL